MLAEKKKVAIVDTCSEIGGDGDIPHPSIGLARRIMVPSLKEQAQVVSQTAQNLSPEVLVVDKIMSHEDVEAVRSCKHQGTRVIASATGDLRKLCDDAGLQGLVAGGVATGVSWQSSLPVFDVVVELQSYDVWKIVVNLAGAVDCIRGGQMYPVQCRTRDPLNGTFQLGFEMG